MAITAQSVEATAAYVFAADQPRLVAVYHKDVGERLRKELQIDRVLIQPADLPGWQGHVGQIVMSPARTVAFKTVVITPLEINATVFGNTADAIDVAKEAWVKLGDLTGQDRELESEVGGWGYKTQMTVKAPGLRDRLAPGLAKTVSYLERNERIRLDQRTSFRLEIRAAYHVHGLEVQQPLVIEPRMASKPEDDVYYTVSPLRSEEHLAWLKALVTD